MMPENIKKQLGLVDSRSQRGILSRGKTRYSGASPNPRGNNSSDRIKLRNKRLKNNGISPELAVKWLNRKKVR